MALTTLINNIPGTLDGAGITNNSSAYSVQQSVTYIQNGLSTDVNKVQFPLQMGVPLSHIYTFKVVPMGSYGSSVVNNFSFGTGSAGGFVPLNTTVTGTGPSVFTIPFTFNGQTGILLDCEQCPFVYFTQSATQEFQVRMQGYDFRGVAVDYTTEMIDSSEFYLCPISFITSIQFLQNPLVGTTSTIFVANNSNTGSFYPQIGLPYFLPNTSYVINASYGGTNVPASNFQPGYLWRQQTTLNPDTYSARGWVELPSASDGVKELIVTYYVYGADSELNNEIINTNQSSLKIVGVQKQATTNYPNPTFVYNSFVSQDLTGVQVNPGLPVASGLGGDNKFLALYAEQCAL